MPKLLEQVEVKIRWTDVDGRLFKEKLGSDKRTSGIHLSGIIQHCLYSDRDPKDPDFMPMNMAFGLAWEAWSIGLWPGVIWQPGEEVMDGVYATPDGISQILINGKWEDVVEEWKATWKGITKYGDILAQTAWMWQLAALCHMQGLRFARIHVLFINGDYRPPSPVYMTYLIEFTKEELEVFWKHVILKNKDKATPEIHD